MFKPDWSKLFTVKIWSDALTQGFGQFSVGYGCTQFLSRFREVQKPIVLFAFIAPTINALTGILSAMVVFGYVGYYTTVNGIGVND